MNRLGTAVWIVLIVSGVAASACGVQPVTPSPTLRKRFLNQIAANLSVRRMLARYVIASLDETVCS